MAGSSGEFCLEELCSFIFKTPEKKSNEWANVLEKYL